MLRVLNFKPDKGGILTAVPVCVHIMTAVDYKLRICFIIG